MVDKTQPPYPPGQHPNSKDALWKMNHSSFPSRVGKKSNKLGGIDPKRADANLKRFD